MNRYSRKNLETLHAEVEATLEDMVVATEAHNLALTTYMSARKHYNERLHEAIKKQKLKKESLLNFKGNVYRLTERKAQVGDVIIFQQLDSELEPNDIQVMVPYEVTREYSTGVAFQDGVTMYPWLVYGNEEQDNFALVFEKVGEV